jgi:hypothetical protein
MAKLNPGDKVKMTPEAQHVNAGAWSFTGVVVRLSKTPHVVRVKRDGLKTVETWHENAWEPLASTQKGNKVK